MISPQPVPAGYTIAQAKNDQTMDKFIVLNIYDVTGVKTTFFPAEAARSLGLKLVEAADELETGLTVVRKVGL